MINSITLNTKDKKSKDDKKGEDIKDNKIGSLVKVDEKELFEWNMDLRKFLIYSNQQWKKKYPQFRANYQGDKTIGYELAKGIVSIPKQYKRLNSVNYLTEKVIQELPSKSFVIKETLGHAGNKVLCMNYNNDTKMYNDYLRHKSCKPEPDELLRYIKSKLTSDSPLIIEELLPFTDDIKNNCDNNNDKAKDKAKDKESVEIKAPPPDYKVYVVNGKVRLINIYFRLPEGRFEMSFKPNWQRIPIKNLYQDIVALNYSDLPETIKFTLPPESVRKELLDVSVKLAHAHSAKFARYDFYIIKDTKKTKESANYRIVLGEITPLCGGIRNNLLKEKMLRLLFPPNVRRFYKADYQR